MQSDVDRSSSSLIGDRVRRRVHAQGQGRGHLDDESPARRHELERRRPRRSRRSRNIGRPYVVDDADASSNILVLSSPVTFFSWGFHLSRVHHARRQRRLAHPRRLRIEAVPDGTDRHERAQQVRGGDRSGAERSARARRQRLTSHADLCSDDRAWPDRPARTGGADSDLRGRRVRPQVERRRDEGGVSRPRSPRSN